MSTNMRAMRRLEFGAKKCPGDWSNSPGAWSQTPRRSRPMTDRNARPLPPYNPEREYRDETHVLVFHDVPEDEWVTAPRGLDFNAWLTEYDEMQAKTADLRRMPYRDYLQTKEWAQLRRLVMGRAGGKCERCQRAADEWNVHHLTYERRGQEMLTDLVLLCRPCHEAVHGLDHH